MNGIKDFIRILRPFKLIQVFIIYVSSSAAILQVIDVLQNNHVLKPDIFKYVLWTLLTGLPVALLLVWIIRKRNLGFTETDALEPGSIEAGLSKPGLHERGSEKPGPDPKKKQHNLPESITRFIGREKETRELVSLVENNRLVTITGEGGCGKTRISLQLARNFLDKFTDGVWFVDLAPLEDPGLVPQELATTLSIAEEQGKSINSTLKERIGEKKFLLLLDNCEHLVDATADLVHTLLSSNPEIKVLATSREALKISGEVLWKVPSLTLPPLETQGNLESLSGSEAVALFLDRAENCKPGFRLSDQNALAIAAICHKLEGIPLAIELAATRIKHMEPAMILDRLQNHFQILTSDSRSTGSRQRTLKATIDWSYNLLSEKEKLLFERISVFSSGFQIQSVEEVCSDDSLGKEEILDTVSKLVDKSMLAIKSRELGSVRYGMLETLKDYASLKLEERHELARLEEKHFDYFLSLADMAFEARLDDVSAWAGKLEAEHDEYRKSIRWAESDPERYLQICGGLGWFWEAHAHYALSIMHLKKALSGYKDGTSYTARALMAFGSMALWLPELAEEAKESLKEALGIWTTIGNRREAGQLHSWLGGVNAIMDDMPSALFHYQEAYTIFNSLGDPKLMITGKFGLGFALVCSFEPQQAEPHIREALEEAVRYNMKREIGTCYHIYGDCALVSRNYEDSLERYRRSLKAIIEAEDHGQAVYELQGVAMSLAGLLQHKDALILNSAALARAEQLGIVIASVGFWMHCLEETIGKAKQELGEPAVAEAEKKGREMDFEQAVAYALGKSSATL